MPSSRHVVAVDKTPDRVLLGENLYKVMLAKLLSRDNVQRQITIFNMCSKYLGFW